MDERVAVLTDTRSLDKNLKGPKMGEYWRYRVGDIRIICNIVDGLIKRILSAEITQAIGALSSARKGETTLRTVKIKLKSVQKISAKKLHPTERSKLQGKSAGMAKEYKTMRLGHCSISGGA